jgi:hypothetical protein
MGAVEQDRTACALRRSVLAVVLACAPIASAARGAELTFELAIEHGRVAPGMRLVRVRQNDQVRLRWTSDRSLILHFHGYDIETRVEPGAVAEMAFAARATGRFPIHGHDPGERDGNRSHYAPLVQIEVHPR